jgi:flavorubredoxin
LKALIVYDSVFGNTGLVAQTIDEGISDKFPEGSQTIHISDEVAEHLKGLDLLIIGSPTRSLRPTLAVNEFLKSLPRNHISDLQVAAFDTRIWLETVDSSVVRFIVDKGGYAASSIAKALQKKGGDLVSSPEGFLVTGEQGPLKEGELERAKEWAREIANQNRENKND